MFHLFRSRKQAFRIVLAVVVAPIIITMVVTLIPGIGGSSYQGDPDLVLAEVGGDEVTTREAQYQLQDYVRSQRFPPAAYGFLAPQVVQNLIADKLLLQEARRLGLEVTEEELADQLRTQLPFLFQEGTFARDRYAVFIQERFQKSIPEFEAEFRKQLALDKLRRLVTDGVIVTPAEVDREFQRRQQKARIEYVAVSTAAAQTSVSSTPAEIDGHFQKNRGLYTLPERRTFHYFVLDDARIAASLAINPKDLERYYSENRDRYRIQERSRVTHILLKTTEKSAEEIKKIEAKAQDILKQAHAGKDFAELAKTNSEDSVSAAKGGEIGWITRGQTVPEFERRAFTMKPGEMSDVVKTQYGFHILKLLAREEARLKPLKEVEVSIREEFAKDKTDLERSRLADRVRAAAQKHAAKPEEAGREVGLPVLTASQIERGNPLPEAGAEPALMDALFSAAKGSVVGPVLMTGKTVVAVVTEVLPSRQAELAEVVERVRTDANGLKARQAAEKRAKDLAEQTKSGGDIRKAAKQIGLEAKTSDWFTREGSIPGVGPASSVGEAFTAVLGSVVGPVSAGGDQIVYRVLERQEGESAASVEEKKTIRQTLVGTRQNEAFEVFKEELRERLRKQGKLKVHQNRLDRFVSANRG